MSLTVSEEGYKSMERQLDSLQNKLQEVRVYKNKIAVENGNVWHDNNDFEQCEIDERRLSREISKLQQTMKDATIICEKEINSKVVNYGAKVEVCVKNDAGENIFNILFSDSDEESEHTKISANSPLGKVIFQKEVGFKDSYKVGDMKFSVEILKIEY